MLASRTSKTSRTDDQCAEDQALPNAEHHIIGNVYGFMIDGGASLSQELIQSSVSALTSFKPGRVVILE